MGDRATIKDVFVQCQTGLQGHGKLIKTLGKLYEKTEFPTFWQEFLHCLKYGLIILKREPAVERLIDFVAKFIPSLNKKEKKTTIEDGEDEEEEEADSVEDNKLLQEMFDFLLKTHSARDRAVRFRCCQLVNKLLINLGEDAQIDDDLYDRLYECMLERLKDKCPMVRYHAVMAMSRLQDPQDENCPVIKAYLFLLNCDPNADVRRAVLLSIAPSTKTLSSIIGRTRDVKDTVRKAAFEVLAEKIHIKAMSIALRLQLLNDGLSDRSEIVKQACSGKLLQTWLRTFDGNILLLLKSLDVEDSTDICSNMLQTLFKASTDQAIIEGFVSLLNENILISEEELTSEAALYWQNVCKHIHSLGTDGDVYMEKVLPSCVDFCAFVQRYADELKTIEDPEIQLGREFIIEHLLLIASYMDTADTASRKAFEALLHNLLIADHVSHRLVKCIVARICSLRGTGENVVPYFAETVSDIREPISLVEKDVEEEQKRQVNLKIAAIRVNLNQLKEDLDEAVKGQDFTKAAELKGSIAELDAEKAQLLLETEPEKEEIRTERNDPLTLLKCQTIICEMLQNLKLNSVSSTLQMMIESQIVPSIQNADADVRSKGIQALGMCCYMNKELLVTYMPLFMQASRIDTIDVRVMALQVIFDLLFIFGLDVVDASETSSDQTAETEGNSTDMTSVEDSVSTTSESRVGTASQLVAIICSFLDEENTELRTCAAEGLAKLLLSGRVVSSKILSHLILLWYNPLSEDDTHLRECLGTFFPLFALAGRSNQEIVEEAFIPTLRTLLNAPSTSPLIEVNVNNVAELLIQLTNSKLVSQNQSATETSQLNGTSTDDNPGHDNLSEKVCNEILSDPESPNVKLWVKILNQMEVSPDNEIVLKDLRVLCFRMLKVVKEKLCRKNLEKFRVTINELVEKFLTGTDDLELIAQEPESMEQETEQEIEPTTPKRKRVRGLYTQNSTLGLESESELDITADDSTVEVDASCLMSRASVTAETPTRSRKNTVTEVTAEDVFIVPGVPGPKKQTSLEKTFNEDQQKSDSSNKDQDNDIVTSIEKESEQEASKSPRKSKSPTKAGKDKAESPSKADKDTAKSRKSKSPSKAAKEVTKSPSNTGKGSDKSRKSRSLSKDKNETTTSPRKSKSPARSARSVSKSPVKSPKEAKSPGKDKSKGKASDKNVRKAAPKSPEKTSKSPLKDSESPEKSPKKASTKSPTKAAEPSKSPAESRKSRSRERNRNKKQTAPAESESSSARSGSSSPMKRKASKSPAAGTSAKKSRSRSAGPNSPQVENTRSSRSDKSTKHPEKRRASKSPEGTAKKISRSRSNNKGKSTDDKRDDNTSPAKTTRRSAIAETKATDAQGSLTPRSVARKNEKTAKVVMENIEDKSSPRAGRNTRTAPLKNTPKVSSKPETKKSTSVADPGPGQKKQAAPARGNTRTARDVPDTPESDGSRSSRFSRRSALSTPNSTISVAETPSPRNVRATRQKAVGTPNAGTPTTGKQAKASPAVPAASRAKKQTTKGTKSGGSASDSSSGSPVKKTKKDTAAKPKTQIEIVSESDSEEDQIVRRARPSRRNVSAVSQAAKEAILQSDQENQIPRRNTRGVVNSPASTLSTPRSGGSLTRNLGKKVESSSQGSAAKRTPRSRATDSDSVFSSPASVSSVTRSSGRASSGKAPTRSASSRTATTAEDPTIQNLEKKLRSSARSTESTSRLRRPLRSQQK